MKLPPRTRFRLYGGLVSLCSVAIPGPLQALTDEEQTFFESRIRPVLVENCYECHASTTKQKGGLLLDAKTGWIRGGESGPAIIPGDPHNSLLYKAITYRDPELEMPPKKRLSSAQIADIERWIVLGAPDPREETVGILPEKKENFDVEQLRSEHWAWQAMTSPPIPPVRDGKWPRSPLDHFVLAGLEAHDLAPAAEAAPNQLIRRLHFDLIGLSPSPEVVQTFMEDPSPVAYEAIVDTLLASPHFGERWGQHWLDLVRFAETWGHEQDFPIPEAWRYRDYVIRAFNADVPYGRLLMEHIAGDLLPEPRLDSQLRLNESVQGTGFWHLGEATHSPVDIREDECLRVANQIDVFSKAFLGITVACARCHDHKFDAVSTRDYYALVGYLQSSNYHLADVSDPELQSKLYTEISELCEATSNSLLEPLESLEIACHLEEEPEMNDPLYPLFEAERTGSFNEARAEVWRSWDAEERIRSQEVASQSVVRTEKNGELNYTESQRPFDPDRDVIIDYRTAGEEEWLAVGWRFGTGPAPAGTLILGDAGNPIRGVIKERAAHAGLAGAKFTGMLRTPTFRVTSDTVWFRCRGRAKLFVAVDSHRVCQGPLHSTGLRQDIDTGADEAWIAHDLGKYLEHQVHLEFTPVDGFSITEIRFSHEKPKELFYVNPIVRKLMADGSLDSAEGYRSALLGHCREALSKTLAGRADPGEVDLADWALLRIRRDMARSSGAPAHAIIRDLMVAYGREREGLESQIPSPTRALTLMDGSAVDEPVHIRGNYRTPSPDAVPRAFLTALDGPRVAPPAKKGSGRLALAEQVVDPANPLTSRVMVNRAWHHLFGRGIVPTVDNFGATGQPPTHPELLDHLASRFVADGWSIKKLVRQLVLSSTYRMDSRPRVVAEQVDPTNRLLHRMPVRRLSAEAIRDHMLMVSGRLDRRSYGPSVPVHISEFMRDNRSPSESGPLDGDGRRSIYLEARRNHPDPLLTAFDKPTPFTAIGQRNVSNSPAQPLIMLNNALVHELAGRWASRLLEDPGATDRARIQQAYMEAFSRAAEEWEIALALEFLDAQAKQYDRDARARAWSDLTHTWLNVKDFIFIN